MPDSAHVFMENVFHLTGYLHRLLFLMKELDIKEHEISKTIEEKEEIYLENLNYIHKQNIKKQSTDNQNDASNECLDQNDYSINQQLENENNHETCNNNKNHLNSNILDSEQNNEYKSDNKNIYTDKFSKREENLKLEIQHDDNKINDDFETKYMNNEILKKNIKTEKDSKHIKENGETSFSSEQLKEKNILSQSDNPNHEIKNIKKIFTDDQMETNIIIHNIDDNLDKYDYIKNENAKEEDEYSDDKKPELLFNEDELNEYLNIITNDRENCMALLREKICINNQISYMIKSYYEKLKKQYDKLYIEMEMNGETPPNIYNTNKNKNEYPDFDDNLNINNNITIMNNNNNTSSGRNKGNYTNSVVGASSVVNYTNENYQYDAYDFEYTKEEDNEIIFNKMNSRKHGVKYDEDYNPYNSEKNKKSKKAKRNKSDNAQSNKLTKNNSTKSNQSVGANKNFNPTENKTNKMRITIGSLADSHLKNNETLKINKTDKTENNDSEDLLFNAGIAADDHIFEQGDKNKENKNEENKNGENKNEENKNGENKNDETKNDENKNEKNKNDETKNDETKNDENKNDENTHKTMQK
ncbi:conserved Plasmodium protein, unknown function [Plasmodium yoelii]|uniref:Inhibitor of growth protein N-terminal histone-binding domain-containing protein n=3 Tax=Plasmodium yoelii TaxID=5861 RepID=A0AAE9WNE7_PLAYO|nr:conserved Plasmodium protein, unknown function [Plasmodium yoelii]EAA22112.1 hypothetical protein [Plasmodium yoelii yoelii]WBY55524.1 hypothetical protein Py17XNL_000504387 [Plasmodium yoelii yoelii]CDU16618.1 conserved Plasmodium protein, unknown function [Plasmodium yoelii]VTZ74060.1 conserved Plasmodium protein, unknown function [Plasmodium yoelii]|eukprot:XP_730547.1 conserved Plasmodium protein, unknown function [Plasmodium yoelii]